MATTPEAFFDIQDKNNLSKALSKEAASETNEFGMPTDPSAVKKRY
mgnify:CR=1 FL=1